MAVATLAALAILAWSFTSIADESPRQRYIRVLAAALAEDLSPPEHAALLRLAKLRDGECEKEGPCALTEPERSTISALRARLIQDGGWQATVLPYIMPTALATQSKVEGILEKLVNGIASRTECKNVHDMLEQSMTSRLRNPAADIEPVSREALTYRMPGKSSCLIASVGEDGAKVLAGHHFVTVYGRAQDTASLFAGGLTPEATTRLPSIVVADNRVFIGAAPYNAGITVAIRAAGEQFTDIWRKYLNVDLPYWSIPDAEPACIDLTLQSDTKSDVVALVDGSYAMEGQVTVRRAAHDIRIVDARTNRLVSIRTLSRESQTTRAFGCTPISVDATGAKAIAVVDVSTSLDCVEMGIDASVLRKRLNTLLGPRNLDVRDIEGLAETFRELERIYPWTFFVRRSVRRARAR